jgi:hypothetical protein
MPLFPTSSHAFFTHTNPACDSAIPIPGCSKSHLPSFMTAQDELKAKGVELTICMATNDAYVMEVSKRGGMLFICVRR